jgi:hypothetical protein
VLGELHFGKLNSLIRIENIRVGNTEGLFHRLDTQKAVSGVVENLSWDEVQNLVNQYRL